MTNIREHFIQLYALSLTALGLAVWCFARHAGF